MCLYGHFAFHSLLYSVLPMALKAWKLTSLTCNTLIIIIQTIEQRTDDIQFFPRPPRSHNDNAQNFQHFLSLWRSNSSLGIITPTFRPRPYISAHVLHLFLQWVHTEARKCCFLHHVCPSICFFALPYVITLPHDATWLVCRLLVLNSPGWAFCRYWSDQCLVDG
jgi:hypothetical protein